MLGVQVDPELLELLEHLNWKLNSVLEESEAEFFRRLRELETPTQKLIYLFLHCYGGKAFQAIYKILGLSRMGTWKAVKRMDGFIEQDDNFVWRIKK